jgi:hypothetical protein
VARGVPLTPEQLQRAAEVYGRSGNLSEAARAIGVAESTLRGAFGRLGVADARELNARAIERGLRKARKRLTSVIEKGGKLLDGVDSPEGYNKVATALARSADALLAIDERRSRRMQSKLTRDKTRAEIELLKAKASGDAAPETVVLTPGDEAFDKLMREKWGAPRQGAQTAPKEPRGGEPESGVGP